MTIDVSEGTKPDDWAPLPTGDRALVGGHTVWTGPFRPPVVVAQPNRWGIIEQSFPDVPCVVEADPPVTGHLPLPGQVVGFLDRTHAPIDEPQRTDAGQQLMESAARLAGALTQIRGVKLAARPFARTIPLLTLGDPTVIVTGCAQDGLVGLRPLPGLGGGVALSVREDHGPETMEAIVAVLRSRLGG